MACFFEKLPDDVVMSHIIGRIVDVKTRVCFAAVCRSWRALSSKTAPLFPRIFVPQTSTSDLLPTLFDPVSTTSYRLFNPIQAKLALIQLKPESTPGGFQGSYLAYTPCPYVHPYVHGPFLYSPFSGKALACLPARHPDMQTHCMQQISKVRLSSDRPRLVAALIAPNYSRIYISLTRKKKVYWKSQWVVSAPIEADYGPYPILDLIFYKGDLYCICKYGGRIYAFDLQNHLHLQNDTTSISSPIPRMVSIVDEDFDNIYGNYHLAKCLTYYNLVESGGELLVITRYYHPREEFTPNVKFKVARLDLEKGVLRPVDTLGDRMIFIGQSECSISWPGPELDTSFFIKNCVYFFHYCKMARRYLVGRYRVGSKHLPAEFLPIPVGTNTCSPLWIFVPTPISQIKSNLM